MNLREYTRNDIHIYMGWLREAQEVRILVELLPEEIAELEGSIGYNAAAKPAILTINLFGGEPALDRCIKLGAVIDKKEIDSGDGTFIATGHFSFYGMLGTVHLKVYCLSTPPGCTVEKETYTATRYKAICNETKEEVKGGIC
jgi:hypothetical protein